MVGDIFNNMMKAKINEDSSIKANEKQTLTLINLRSRMENVPSSLPEANIQLASL